MTSIIIEQNIPSPMRDGTILYSDIYRPAEPGNYPVLLTRLPYGKQLILPGLMQIMDILRASRAGYVVIVQDCRGRFASEGQFDYCAYEGEDGYDTVEWAANLPYSTGDVGMFGLSYFGWTQWSAAQLHPPHLRAIAPMQTWTDHSGMRFRNGAFELADTLQWMLRMSMEELTRELNKANRSIKEVDTTMRSVVSFLDKLSEGGFFEVPLRHIQSLESLGLANIIGRLLDLPPGKQRTGYRINFTDVEVPSLNIAGWYDIFQQYTIDNFMSVITRGKRLARCAHLLIGPWMHGVIAANPGMMIGEINFGSGASGASIDLKQDLTSIQLRWFDHWLKHIDNGVERETPVKFLLTGENRWIESPCWPPQETQETPLFFHAGGRLNFKLPEDANNATFFTYDPANPAPTLGGNAPVERPGVRDQRPLSERSDVLTFTCSTLEQKLTVVGRIIADLWVSSSAPDTDFVARLIDVHPSGYMQNLCDGIIRARYRESLQEPSWLEPGKVFNLKVDLWSIAHVFKPGHRLAVQITGSSFPRWDRNWNTAGNPGAAISGQPARQTIWHSTEHPSHIILPVLKN